MDRCKGIGYKCANMPSDGNGKNIKKAKKYIKKLEYIDSLDVSDSERFNLTRRLRASFNLNFNK